MMRSLYSGVSGLKTHQTKMDVIGNNIANVNTVAFKSSSTTFSDIMYQTTSGATGATATTGGRNPNQIGLGVTSGSTKVSITSSGAAQSTGEAFDIKLTDSNNTNFFIVNNGSQNVFTRAGSFYIDGNGNLCMSSTGYTVMGWQVDAETGNIKKDTVSALRIMNAANLTSAPESTKNAVVSGVIDKNDTDVTSDSGYYMSLSFYDNLGYEFTAKYSVRATHPDKGEYSVELINIYDSDMNDILQKWLDGGIDGATHTKDELFGNNTHGEKSFAIDKGMVTIEGSTMKYTEAGTTYDLDITTGNVITQQGGEYGLQFGGTTGPFVPLTSLYGNAGLSASILDTADAGYNEDDFVNGMKINPDGSLSLAYPTVNYKVAFNTNDGKLKYVEEAGKKSQIMNMSLLGDAFDNIEVDFTNCLNYDNGGSSTMGIEKGDLSGTRGIGKKLGNMTGCAIDGTGKIYGSYDNGNTVLLGQIAVAQFANASGLEALGNSCYNTTLNSGDFDGIGVEVTADGGSMTTGQLEMSNVDLSAEFTEMITTQRGFQANSRIITTSDTLLEELVNLKR